MAVGGGADFCLWQYCVTRLSGGLGMLISLGGCGSLFGLVLHLKESRITVTQALVSSLPVCKKTPDPPWKVLGLCLNATCAVRGGCKASKTEVLTPQGGGVRVRISLGTRAGALEVATVDLLRLGSVSRKNVTLAGREHGECVSACAPHPCLSQC